MNSAPTRNNPFASIDSFDDFQPKPAAESNTSNQAKAEASKGERKAVVAQLAQESGFKINNFEETPLPAKRKTPEPKTFLKTIRIHVSDWNRFQLWCNENNYSHKRGFQIVAQNLPAKEV